MNKSGRAFRVYLIAFVIACPMACMGANLTVNDSCSASLSGQVSATDPTPAVSVTGTGDITAIGFTANANSYVAGVGLPCPILPAGTKPLCVLSASSTRVLKNDTNNTTPVTLYARCSGVMNSYNWVGPVATVASPNGPGVPTSPTTSPSLAVKFPSAGAYSYSVAGTSSGGTAGTLSPPVTILVEDASVASSDTPTCVLTASPNVVAAGGNSNLQATCNPDATSYFWENIDNGPTTPGSASTSGAANMQFSTAGIYTYKVTASNANGVGLKASAVVNVTGGSSNPNLPTFVNGNFESPALGAASNGSVTMIGWTAASTNDWIVNNAWLQAQGLSSAPEGTQALKFVPSGYMAQNVTFNSIGIYNLSFSATVSTVPNVSIGIEMDGGLITTNIFPTVGVFKSFTVPINVTTTGSHLFWIFCGGTGTAYCVIDNVRFTP